MDHKRIDHMHMNAFMGKGVREKLLTPQEALDQHTDPGGGDNRVGAQPHRLIGRIIEFAYETGGRIITHTFRIGNVRACAGPNILEISPDCHTSFAHEQRVVHAMIFKGGNKATLCHVNLSRKDIQSQEGIFRLF